MDQQNRKQHLNEIQSACTDLKPKPKRRGPKPKVKLLVEPRVIRTIPKQKDHVNHSYSDYSNVPPEDGYIAPFKIDEMSFSEKLFDILKKETKYASCIAWRPHGRAFAINVPAMFEKEVCELYFGHKRYSSFLRQVNNYGFKHITAGNDRNCYYHECFLKGMPHLCKYMPGPKDSRRQIADPTNEPNFEAISCVHPVPPLNVPFQSPNVVVPKKEPFVPVTMALPPTANESLSFVAAATKSAPAERTGKASANAIVSNSQIFPKASMDRDAALAEIKILRAHLNADVLPLSSSPGSNVALEQGPNRSSLLGSGYIGQTPVQQLARMPNPFPTRSRGLSQLESILERNAIVVGIRKQHEQEALQQQQLQDIQVQQKLQEFLTQQQQLEDIQAQRKLQEIKAQETFQQLQTHQALGEFQKQQAIQELQRKTMAQHIQYQHNVQSNFNSYAALPVAQQPLMSPPPPQSTQAHFPQPTNFDNSATISELLRLGYRFPPNA